jgi:hypothetical protein
LKYVTELGCYGMEESKLGLNRKGGLQSSCPFLFPHVIGLCQCIPLLLTSISFLHS